MDYKLLLEELNYFNDIISIQEIKKGFHKRKKFKVITSDKDYFVKISPYLLSEEDIKRLKWLMNQYELLKIPVIHLDEILILPDKKLLFYIYNFVEGESLKDSDLPLNVYESYGYQVGEYLQRLKTITNSPLNTFDFEKYTKKKIKNLDEIIQQKKDGNSVIPLSLENLLLIQNQFGLLLSKINTENVHIVHGDVKTENFILNKQYELVVADIDVENLSKNFIDVQYVIFYTIFDKIKEKIFLKGYFQKIFEDLDIAEIEISLQYIFLANVIHVLYEVKNDENLAIKYFSNTETVLKIIENRNHYVYNFFLNS